MVGEVFAKVDALFLAERRQQRVNCVMVFGRDVVEGLGG